MPFPERCTTPTVWKKHGTPSRMTDEQMASYLCPASHRLSPRQRKDAVRKVQDAQWVDWFTKHSLSGHALKPKEDLSEERTEALREAFNLMDADRSGRINVAEVATVMKVFGFASDAIRTALKEGDKDSDGELDFGEYTALIQLASARSDPGDGGMDAEFPFTLVANSFKISRLIDSCALALCHRGSSE